MAKLTLKGDASGSIDLTVPAAAGANTIVLPPTTGDVVVATAVTSSVDNVTTNKIAIEINGTVYYLLATTSAV